MYFTTAISTYNAELIRSQVFKSRDDYISDACIKFYSDCLYIINLYNNYTNPYTKFWLSERAMWFNNILNENDDIGIIVKKNNLIYGNDYVKIEGEIMLSSYGLDKLFDGDYKGTKPCRDFRTLEYVNDMYDEYYEDLNEYGNSIISDYDNDYWSGEEVDY